MRRDAKASSAGSNGGKSTRRLWSLLAVLALALCALGSGAPSALAATPVMGTVTKVFSTSAHLTAKVENPVGPTYWRFDYSTDQTNWVEGPEGAHGGPISPGDEENVTGDFSGLAAETEYFVRFAVYDEGTGNLNISGGPNPSFMTTAAVTEAATVLATGDASEVGFSTVKATGEVQRPVGEDPALDATCNFEYITDAAYLANPVGERFSGATPVGCEPDNVIKAPGVANVEAILPNLTTNTTYHLRLVASNGAGTDSKEASATFTTQAATAPVLALDPAVSVKYTEAQISGTIDPEGGNTNPIGPTAVPIGWTLQYALASEPGNWQTAETGTIEGPEAESSSPISVPASPAQLANLINGSEYKFRLVASYAGKEAISSEGSFETEALIAPSVSIDPITTFTGTSAHFSGTVNPNGGAAAFNSNWHFQCIPTCPGLSGGTVTADGSSHAVSEDASGLDPNTSYEVKLVASNAGGQGESATESFETDPTAPAVQTLYAGSIGTGSATLAALVNPRNSTTTYQFEWGVGNAFDHVAPATPADLGATDNILHFVSGPISGLDAGTEYRFRVVATNTETSESSTAAAHTFTSLDVAGPPAPCGNEAVRNEQGSTRLPDCRAYELVSPADKNGGNLTGDLMVTPDGSRISATSSASFANPKSNLLSAPYVSERRADGWVTTNLAPPAGIGLALDGGFLQFGNFSGDLTRAISQTANFEGEPQFKNIFVTTLGGDTTWVTAPTQPNPVLADKFLAGSSADASHILFESQEGYSSRDTFGTRQIWEWVDGEVRLVSVLPDDSLALGPSVGTGANAVLSENTGSVAMFREPTAVSADGSRIFFSASAVGGRQLYVREDGTKTIQISLSQKTGSVGQPSQGNAIFKAAAVDGSKVVFTSADQLTNDATAGGGIYRYDLESGDLEFLSPSLQGSPDPEIVGVSADASQVYFVARAQLVPGEGEAGAHNLYVTGQTGIRFIATLADLDFSNWAPLGPVTFNTVRITPDGDHAVFQSIKQLTGYQSEGHVEIYEWDDPAQRLSCVSCGAPGTQASGNASLLPSPVNPELESYNGQIQLGYQRAISDDGSRVFFETTDSLDPKDINGKQDVYVYEAGRTHLISDGTGSRDSEIVGSSASGEDVFFSTNRSLAPQDTDGGAGDTYTARVGGGFEIPLTPSGCDGGDCQPGASPPSFQSPGSSALGGDGSRAKTGRAQKLRAALRVCRKKKPKKARQRCESGAKKRLATTMPSNSRGI